LAGKSVAEKTNFAGALNSDRSSALYADGRAVSACVAQPAPFVSEHADVYYTAYYVFRVVFVNVLPCTVLVLLNAALVHTID